MKSKISIILCIFAAVVWAQNGGVSTKKVQQSSSLVVAAREFKPFTFYNKLNGIHAGIDYDLVVTIAKQLQVDVEFIRADKIDSTDRIDLIIGGLNRQHPTVHFPYNFSWSQPYFFRDDMTWCVHRAKQIPSWMNIFYIVSLDVIVLAFVCFVLSSYLMYGLTAFEDRPMDIWKIFFLFAQGISLSPHRFDPKQIKLRIIYAIGLLIVLAITTTGLAFYYDFLLEPRYNPQIHTFNQIVNANYRLGGDKTMRVYLEKRKLLTGQQMNTFVECSTTLRCLQLLEHNEDMAVAVPRQNAYSTIFSRNIFCFNRSNNIQNYSVALLLHEQRIEIPQWNELIQRCIEAGLIEKWANDYYEQRRQKDNGHVVVIQPLATHNFYGCLVLYGLFWWATVSTFIMEIIVCTQLRNRNPHWLWRTIDWIIDGQRHFLKNLQKRKAYPPVIPVRTYRSRLYPIPSRLLSINTTINHQ